MPENISYKRPLQAEQARSEQLALQVEMLESRVRELERSTHDPLSLQVEEIVEQLCSMAQTLQHDLMNFRLLLLLMNFAPLHLICFL